MGAERPRPGTIKPMGATMKYYTTTTEYNCGVDLHARNMYLCLMDRAGKVLVHENIKDNDTDYFLQRVAPYRHDLTVTFESCFLGTWFADLCRSLTSWPTPSICAPSRQGQKHNNDKEIPRNSPTACATTASPPAYVCPRAVRPIRALVRRRMTFVQNRSRLLGFSMIDLMAHGRKTPQIHARSRTRWCAARQTRPDFFSGIDL